MRYKSDLVGVRKWADYARSQAAFFLCFSFANEPDWGWTMFIGGVSGEEFDEGCEEVGFVI